MNIFSADRTISGSLEALLILPSSQYPLPGRISHTIGKFCLIFNFIEVELSYICVLLSGFFSWTLCLYNWSPLYNITVIHSFLLLHSTQLYDSTTIYLFYTIDRNLGKFKLGAIQIMLHEHYVHVFCVPVYMLLLDLSLEMELPHYWIRVCVHSVLVDLPNSFTKYLYSVGEF